MESRQPGDGPGDEKTDETVDAAVALSELAAADSPAVDERIRADFARLLETAPGALHRDGEAFGADGRRIHLTASAFVLDRDGEALALLWHRKGRFWVQPGGHIDHGETSLESAARREVAEEIGLEDLERLGPGPALLHRHALSDAFGACGEHWDVEYIVRAHSPASELARIPSPEGLEIRWIPWPRAADGTHSRVVPLPDGTVPDLAGKLRLLASYVDRWIPGE